MITQHTQLIRRTGNIYVLLLISLLLNFPGIMKADDNIRIKSSIEAKSASSITINMLEILVDSSTKIQTEEQTYLTFSDLKVGDYIQVDAYTREKGILVASNIRMLNSDMSMNKVFNGSITAKTLNSLTVNGSEVFVDSNTVILTKYHIALQFSDLAVGDNILVKAIQTTGGQYFASVIWIETERPNKEIEIEGKIQTVSDSSITVQNIEFNVDSMTIIVADMMGIIHLSDLTVGEDVSVHGFMNQDSTYTALLIKVDGNDFTRKDLELQGPITEINTNSIIVSNVICYVDSSTIIFAQEGTMLSFSDLKLGDVVEVKVVQQSDGSYKAARIKVENDASKKEIEVAGNIDAINSNNISVGGYTIYVNGQTKIYNHERQTLTFSELTIGTFVIVGAYSQNGNYYASWIKVKDNINSEVHITGAIDKIEGSSITVRGLVFVTDPNTDFLDNNRIPITFNDLKTGQIVNIEGTLQNGNQYYALSVKVENFWRSAVNIQGTIDSLGINSIKIANKIFMVDSTTVIIGHGIGIINFQSLTLGLKVEIKAVVDSNGKLIVKLIKVHPANEFKVYGIIDSLYSSQLVVAGKTFSTDSKTVYFNEFDSLVTYDSLKVGQTIEVRYVTNGINGNLAVRIEIEKEPGSAEFNGIVTLVNSDNFQLSIPSFTFNSKTVFLNSTYTPIAASSIQSGQTLTVWANQGTNGNLYAVQVLQLSSGVTTVKDNSQDLPTEFALKQNYPNPFNPSTKISFTLAKAENVVLKVYNIIGQEVANLVTGQMDAGSHIVIFNGANLASGIYFYRLQAGSLVAIKKMILLK